MKLKVFLMACVVLLACQSTKALPIIVANNWYEPIKVMIKTTLYGRAWLERDVLMPRDAVQYDLEKDDTIYIGKSMQRGYNVCRWGIVLKDLEKRNIPLTGDHSITIYVENNSGKLGVLVDEDEAIYINARLINMYGPQLVAAGAA